MIRRVMAAILLVVAAGCTTMVAPTTFEQRAAYLQGSITSTRGTCANLLERGRMNVEDGKRCLTATDQAHAALQAALAASGRSAEDSLAMAQQIMATLEELLRRNSQ